MLRRLLTICIALGFAFAGSIPTQIHAAEVGNLRTALQATPQQTAWPVGGTGSAHVADADDGRHGIDIRAHEGDEVLAAADGELWQVVELSGLGTTVVLRHTFDAPTQFQGKDVTYYYTWYGHLSSVDDGLLWAAAHGKHPVVHVGDVIGAVGHTGEAESNHLHFEVRVGTSCSLEYQQAHPTAACAAFGFDPHVHPMLLFAQTASALPLVDAHADAYHDAVVAIDVTALDSMNVERLYTVASPAAVTSVLRTVRPAPVLPRVAPYDHEYYRIRVTERDMWGRGITTVW